MPLRRIRHPLLWALVAAVAIGFAFGWFARIWYAPTPESRAREAAHELQEKARRWTR
jgi:hypothetical protein